MKFIPAEITVGPTREQFYKIQEFYSVRPAIWIVNRVESYEYDFGLKYIIQESINYETA